MMEPGPTFAEVARVLRPGGLFAPCYCLGEPAVRWDIDAAVQRFIDTSKQIRRPGVESIPPAVKQRWSDGHLARLRQSGHFRHVTEIHFHHVGENDAWRLLNAQRSYCGVYRLERRNSSELDAAMQTLRKTLGDLMGDRVFSALYSYRLWLAVK